MQPSSFGESLNELLQRSVTQQAPVAQRGLPTSATGLELNQQQAPTQAAEFTRNNANIVNQGQSALQAAMQRRQQQEQASLQQAQQRLMQGVQPRNVNVGIDVPMQQGNIPTGSGQFRGATGSFGAFMKAISSQESGGNYGALNKSSGAMGKYQIMPGNIKGNKKGWDYEALGRDISTSEFMRNPQLQEQIAQYKLQQYYKQWGPRGAAIAWYAGPGAVKKLSSKALNAPQGQYPSINDYAASILRKLGL